MASDQRYARADSFTSDHERRGDRSVTAGALADAVAMTRDAKPSSRGRCGARPSRVQGRVIELADSWSWHRRHDDLFPVLVQGRRRGCGTRIERRQRVPFARSSRRRHDADLTLDPFVQRGYSSSFTARIIGSRARSQLSSLAISSDARLSSSHIDGSLRTLTASRNRSSE